MEFIVNTHDWPKVWKVTIHIIKREIFLEES